MAQTSELEASKTLVVCSWRSQGCSLQLKIARVVMALRMAYRVDREEIPAVGFGNISNRGGASVVFERDSGINIQVRSC